jgi:putative membrane protein
LTGEREAWAQPRRLHPLSVLVNLSREGGRLLAVLIVVLVGGRSAGLGNLAELAAPVAAVGFGVLTWLRTTFQVEGEELRLTSGVVFRQIRTGRLDRVQAMDLNQPFAARLLGLAELRLQFAGGEHGEFRLASVRHAEATALRAHLLNRVTTTPRPTPPPDAETPPAEIPPSDALPGDEHVLFALSTRMFLGSMALSATVWAALLATVAALALGSRSLLPGGITTLLGGGSVLLGAAGFLYARAQRSYGFTLSTTNDDGALRLRHGLLNRFTHTVPVGRIQAVAIREPLLWRTAGWAQVRISVAGHADGGEDEEDRHAASMLLPVAPRDVALRIASRLLGTDLAAVTLRPVPDRAAARLGPWRRAHGYGYDDQIVVAAGGLFEHVRTAIRHDKIQSIMRTQGPWQRALSLSSVTLHATRGPVQITIAHQDADEAEAFVLSQAARACPHSSAPTPAQ